MIVCETVCGFDVIDPLNDKLVPAGPMMVIVQVLPIAFETLALIVVDPPTITGFVLILIGDTAGCATVTVTLVAAGVDIVGDVHSCANGTYVVVSDSSDEYTCGFIIATDVFVPEVTVFNPAGN